MDQKCRCPIRPGMSKQELIEEIYRGPLNPETGYHETRNCCASQGRMGGYICPTLDRELRRADKEVTWRKYQSKKKAGTSKSPRKRGAPVDWVEPLDLSDL